VGPNGRPLCRWCGTEVSGRRRTWCSDACVHEYLGRQWGAIRAQVIRRDQACRECGLTYPATARTRWEVDHIVPVADGGGAEMENLRLLCVTCHKRVTAEWRRSRARLATLTGEG
jgi:5-methylcytosine-specific restriction protein A